MKNRFNVLWSRVSRIGLREEEGVLEYREVIFLNRMLAILPLVLMAYVPFEIYLNGVSMLPVVVSMIVLFMLPLLLHHYRLFRMAHYYIFLIGPILITLAGLMVGRGVNNHVTLIPVLLVGVIIFKTTAERIMALCVVLAFFFLQQYFFETVTPQVMIADDIKATFSHIFFVIATVLSFLLGYYFLGINKEYEDIITEQKQDLINKNKEITDSIAYAKRIQSAILPPENRVRTYFPESFVLYIPKDIVAGDFYWLDKQDDVVLFAVADCTGHGVPGAMVSVVCNNALNRSVREFGLAEPASILGKVREIVIREFQQNEEVQDGMDISLCALDMKTRSLQWAGANNPLVIIREKNLIEYKPDKQPVGKFMQSKSFTNHTISLRKGDCVYLFSDGYADQFGGPRGKKLKYKTFKQVLLACHDQTPEDQKIRLEQELDDWKRGIEQVDDICIMGMKV